MNKYEKHLKRLGVLRLSYEILKVPSFSAEIMRFAKFHYRMRGFKRLGKKTHYILRYYGYLPGKQKKTGLKTLKKKS
jgi:hypothetical protein